MTRIWVGCIVFGSLVLAALGGAGSEPNASLYRNDFFDGDGNYWTLVSGNISLVGANGWAGDPLSWLVLEDNDDFDGAKPSHVRADDPAVNTTMASYAIHATIQRDADYIAPGMTAPNARFFGLTFGDAGFGYYQVGFRTFDNGTRLFHLSVPNGTSGMADRVHTQWDWGTVPEWIDTVEVDGTTIAVKVDGWPLGQFTLTGVPAGRFGLSAGEDTRIYVEQFFYEPLDTEAPIVELWRPSDSNLYLADEPVPIPATGLIVAAGELTFGADVFDNISGTKSAYAYVDGVLQSGSQRRDPGIGETWTIDTLGLSIGEHTLTVRAYDYAGNMAQAHVQLIIVGTTVDSRTTALVVDTAMGVVNDLMP